MSYIRRLWLYHSVVAKLEYGQVCWLKSRNHHSLCPLEVYSPNPLYIRSVLKKRRCLITGYRGTLASYHIKEFWGKNLILLLNYKKTMICIICLTYILTSFPYTVDNIFWSIWLNLVIWLCKRIISHVSLILIWEWVQYNYEKFWN